MTGVWCVHRRERRDVVRVHHCGRRCSNAVDCTRRNTGVQRYVIVGVAGPAEEDIALRSRLSREVDRVPWCQVSCFSNNTDMSGIRYGTEQVRIRATLM